MPINGNQTLLSGLQKNSPEKRRAMRTPFNAPIIFTRFTTRNEVKFRTKTFDCSPEGMAFELEYPLRKGDSLFIHTEYPFGAKSKFYHSRDRQCLRITTLAEVKWCREMSGESEYNYRVGVKYF